MGGPYKKVTCGRCYKEFEIYADGDYAYESDGMCPECRGSEYEKEQRRQHEDYLRYLKRSDEDEEFDKRHNPRGF